MSNELQFFPTRDTILQKINRNTQTKKQAVATVKKNLGKYDNYYYRHINSKDYLDEKQATKDSLDEKQTTNECFKELLIDKQIIQAKFTKWAGLAKSVRIFDLSLLTTRGIVMSTNIALENMAELSAISSAMPIPHAIFNLPRRALRLYCISLQLKINKMNQELLAARRLQGHRLIAAMKVEEIKKSIQNSREKAQEIYDEKIYQLIQKLGYQDAVKKVLQKKEQLSDNELINKIKETISEYKRQYYEEEEEKIAQEFAKVENKQESIAIEDMRCNILNSFNFRMDREQEIYVRERNRLLWDAARHIIAIIMYSAIIIIASLVMASILSMLINAIAVTSPPLIFIGFYIKKWTMINKELEHFDAMLTSFDNQKNTLITLERKGILLSREAVEDEIARYKAQKKAIKFKIILTFLLFLALAPLVAAQLFVMSPGLLIGLTAIGLVGALGLLMYKLYRRSDWVGMFKTLGGAIVVMGLIAGLIATMLLFPVLWIPIAIGVVFFLTMLLLPLLADKFNFPNNIFGLVTNGSDKDNSSKNSRSSVVSVAYTLGFVFASVVVALFSLSGVGTMPMMVLAAAVFIFSAVRCLYDNWDTMKSFLTNNSSNERKEAISLLDADCNDNNDTGSDSDNSEESKVANENTEPYSPLLSQATGSSASKDVVIDTSFIPITHAKPCTV